MRNGGILLNGCASERRATINHAVVGARQVLDVTLPLITNQSTPPEASHNRLDPGAERGRQAHKPDQHTLPSHSEEALDLACPGKPWSVDEEG